MIRMATLEGGPDRDLNAKQQTLKAQYSDILTKITEKHPEYGEKVEALKQELQEGMTELQLIQFERGLISLQGEAAFKGEQSIQELEEMVASLKEKGGKTVSRDSLPAMISRVQETLTAHSGNSAVLNNVAAFIAFIEELQKEADLNTELATLKEELKIAGDKLKDAKNLRTNESVMSLLTSSDPGVRNSAQNNFLQAYRGLLSGESKSESFCKFIANQFNSASLYQKHLLLMLLEKWLKDPEVHRRPS